MTKFERAKKAIHLSKEVLALTLSLSLGGVALVGCSTSEQTSNPKPKDLTFIEKVEKLHLPWGDSGIKIFDGDSANLVLPDGEEVDVNIFKQGVQNATNIVPEPANVGEIDVEVYPKGTNFNPSVVPKYVYYFSQGNNGSNPNSWNPNIFVATYTDYPDVNTPSYNVGNESSYRTDVIDNGVSTYRNGNQLTSRNSSSFARSMDRTLEQQALQILEDVIQHQNLTQQPETS